MDKLDLEPLIRKITLQNAIHYGGSARSRPVIGKLIAERPDLKAKINEITKKVNLIIKDINKLSLHEQKKILEENWPQVLSEREIRIEKEGLPPLPNVENYPFVHVRFAPNPDGSLHLGGSRAAILCDEYAKKYNGLFTLRFDDSDPKTKSPILEAYKWIREDLQWLGVKWHDEVYQSNRLRIYYNITKRLINNGDAYVCNCDPEKFKSLIIDRKACVCRTLLSEEHLERWGYMLNGCYDEGDAVVRIKTDLNHPNPAVRDWPALRIIDVDQYPHPRVGNEYRVWPLFAYCCGVDDHDLQISHILRGKEHLTNTTRQLFLYNHLGWKYPEAIHYGRLKMAGTILSKSKIRNGIKQGIYKGWDDPRLATLKTLRRRGFSPETIRLSILDVGPRPVDVMISWENITAYNRKKIDPSANRYFFLVDPIPLVVEKLEKTFKVRHRLHPDYPERGYRTSSVVPRNNRVSLLISKTDLKLLESGKIIRLIGLFNIVIKTIKNIVLSTFYSEPYLDAKRIGAPLIHWLPRNTGLQASVVMPDSSRVNGLVEDSCSDSQLGEVVQFERFGFVRIDNSDGRVIVYYAHS